MWQQVFDLAVSNGLWAVLFLGLLVYVLKDAGKREGKYRDTIDVLVERLNTVEEVKSDTETILDDTAAIRKTVEGTTEAAYDV